jgi:hypothetical protein
MAEKQWPTCEVCGKPVSTEDGILAVSMQEIQEYRRRHAEWEQEHHWDAEGSVVLSSGSLFDLPEWVKWHHGHMTCLPEYSYTIPYTRFDTIRKALSWTLHLMEKNWLPCTDWRAAVRAHHHVGAA